GRAMEQVFDDESLATYMREAVEASPEHPVLIDRFLRDAIEVDVDLLADRTGACLIGGLKEQSVAMARALGVVGLMNVQYAIQKGDDIYVLEANPRASRTVPFV